jgi:hypothetical protein
MISLSTRKVAELLSELGTLEVPERLEGEDATREIARFVDLRLVHGERDWS